MRHGSGSFGESLRACRRRAGLTQQELARRARVSVRAVRDIEQGRVRRPRSASLQRLAAAVGMAPAEAAAAASSALPGSGTQAPDTAPAGAQHLTVRVLGPLTVDRDAQPVVVPSMQRILLGLLALQPNQAVGRAEIIDALWGEDPPSSCHSLVGTYVARLRKLLEPARARGAPARVLVAAGGGYGLTVGDGELDLLRFDRLVAGARQVQATNPARVSELLAQALECWRGPVLADLPPRVRQHPAAVAASQRRLAAGLDYADVAIELGEHQQAAARLQALVVEEPLHEGLHARLMLALAGSGQQAAALAVFTRLRERLAEELGVEPGEQLQTAQARVLRGDVPGGSAPDCTAATGATGPRPAQLPADVAGFTGRAGHLEHLDALLQAGDGGQGTAVVVTAIAGTAGVGKTALAVHWAHRVAGAFGDGQLYVNLQGYAAGPPLEPLQALAKLLRALGAAPERIPAEVEEAAGLYRSLLAGKRVLVVLDNARDAEQVRPLLPGSPGCVAAITSRDRLTGLVATHGARRLTVDVLAPEEAAALLGRMLGAGRVAAEPQAARELAAACAFLPLALRIAAANLTGHSEGSIAAYLAELRAGDRLGRLAVDGDPEVAVRVAFDASYGKLMPEARRLFRLLGLVPGPQVSTPGAAVLAGVSPERARRLLNTLVDAHLVDLCGVGRFGLHDLLRLYARERAEREDGWAACQAALGRLLEWYLHAADAAAKRLHPAMLRLPVPPAAAMLPPIRFDEPAGAMAWLDTERANLVAAVQHAAEHGPRPTAWLLADALRSYFWLRRHTIDWLAIAQAGLTAATDAGDLRAQAASRLSLASAHQTADRYWQAIQHYTTALELARQAGWADGQAASLGNLGLVYWELGDLREAADHFTQALAINRRLGRVGGQATALLSLGLVARELGRLREAADYFTQALTLYRQLGGGDGESHALGSLGEVDHDLGRLDDAHAHLTQALTLHRQVGDRYGEAYAMHVLAAVHRDAGRHPEALELAQAAVALAVEIGDRSVEALTRNTLASIHLIGDRPKQAADGYRQALDLARKVGARVSEAGARLGLAAVDQHTGQYPLATRHARQAIALATKSGFQVLAGQAHTALAAAHSALGNHDQALGHAEQALYLHRQTGHRLGQARTLHLLGSVRHQTHGSHAAAAHWQEALELFTGIGSPEADEVRPLLDT